MRTSAITLACAALALTSCATVSYKTTGFDVLRPADYTLPSWADTVLLANGVAKPVCNDSTIPAGDAGFAKNMWVYTRGLVTAMFDEMKTNFNESGYISLRYIDRPQTITPQLVDSLLKSHPHTVILALDELECDSRLRVSGSVIDEDNNGVEGCLDIVSRTSSRLTLIAAPYSRMSLTPRTDTLIFTSCGATTAEVVHGFPILSIRYKEQGRETGKQYAECLLPTWQRVYRSLYVTNTTEMSSAATWVDRGEWQEAKNLWASIYDGKAKTPEKVRAAINMATAYEREDAPVEASMWCSKALDLIEKADAKTATKLAQEKRRAESMFAYLLTRAAEQKTLDKQMN